MVLTRALPTVVRSLSYRFLLKVMSLCPEQKKYPTEQLFKNKVILMMMMMMIIK